MRKIIFCIVLYSFTSLISSQAVEFELSDVIKQARENEKAKHQQIKDIDKNIKQVDNKNQNLAENINSQQITNSSIDNSSEIQKEQ